MKRVCVSRRKGESRTIQPPIGQLKLSNVISWAFLTIRKWHYFISFVFLSVVTALSQVGFIAKNPTTFCRLYLFWSQSLYTSAHFEDLFATFSPLLLRFLFAFGISRYGFHLLGEAVITIIITIKYYEICSRFSSLECGRSTFFMPFFSASRKLCLCSKIIAFSSRWQKEGVRPPISWNNAHFLCKCFCWW